MNLFNRFLKGKKLAIIVLLLLFSYAIIPTVTANNPPNEPSNPSPADGATEVDIETLLPWSCSDPNPGDTLRYYIQGNTAYISVSHYSEHVIAITTLEEAIHTINSGGSVSSNQYICCSYIYRCNIYAKENVSNFISFFSIPITMACDLDGDRKYNY